MTSRDDNYTLQQQVSLLCQKFVGFFVLTPISVSFLSDISYCVVCQLYVGYGLCFDHILVRIHTKAIEI